MNNIKKSFLSANRICRIQFFQIRKLHCTVINFHHDNENEHQNELDLQSFRRYLLLTSRNRGRIETELFLGGYALHNDRIWKMSQNELNAYSKILEYTDNELYEYLVGQSEPPEDLKNNSEFQLVFEYVKKRGESHYSNPNRKSFDEDYLKNDCSPPQTP